MFIVQVDDHERYRLIVGEHVPIVQCTLYSTMTINKPSSWAWLVFFFLFFWPQVEVSPSTLRVLRAVFHHDCAAHQDHSGRCRIQTRNPEVLISWRGGYLWINMVRIDHIWVMLPPLMKDIFAEICRFLPYLFTLPPPHTSRVEDLSAVRYPQVQFAWSCSSAMCMFIVRVHIRVYPTWLFVRSSVKCWRVGLFFQIFWRKEKILMFWKNIDA